MLKRIMALFLSLVIVFTAVPWAAMAAQTEPDATVQANDVTVEGTNGFGSLLSAEIVEAQEETAEAYESGYTVTDLVIEGNAATVTYDALGEANLVVALYTEDGMQLLTSANTTVTADATEATVTFAGDMPEYFLASAYLVDTYDFSPLCEAYDTPMYTKDMQELLASTVEDYDPDRVLQLTEDTTTNFAVYAEDVIRIEYAEGVNTVASADDENLVYVIENADEQITGLNVGEVFAYSYGENEMLIVKVGSISVDGTTVTVTGEDLEINDVFSHLKIECVADTGDAVVDESTIDENLTFNGLSDGVQQYSDNEAPALLNSDSDEGSAGTSLNYTLEPVEIDGIVIEANLSFSVTAIVNYYFTESLQRIDVRFETGMEGSCGVTGKLGHEFPLGELLFPIFGIAEVGLDPAFVVEFEGSLTATFGYDVTLGAVIEHDEQGWHRRPIYSPGEPDFFSEFEGKVFIGLELSPVVRVAKSYIAEVKITAKLGFEATLSQKFNGELSDSEKHDCTFCAAGILTFKLSLTPSAKLFKSKKLTFSASTNVFSIKITDLYWSIEHDEFGLGKCPYRQFQIIAAVVNKENIPIPEVTVFANKESAVTNKDGVAEFFLPVAEYVLETTVGEESAKYTIYADQAQKITLMLGEVHDGYIDQFGGQDNIDNSGDSLPLDEIGKQVVIYSPISNKALSSEYSGLYNIAVNVTMEEGVLVGYSETEIWTMANNEEGTYCFSNGDVRIGVDEGYHALYPDASEEDALWELIPADEGLYIIKNVRSGRYMVYNSKYNDWGNERPDNLHEYDEYLLNIYVVPQEYKAKQGAAAPTLGATFCGKYGSEDAGVHILRTATFSGLVPGEQYLLLAMASIDADTPLAPENLLFIDQAAAGEDGTLTFTYVQRVTTDPSFVVACGAANKTLADATITFPEMVADGELHAVEPTVVYDGTTLQEGRDYEITGTVSYTEAGTYICYIRGIHNYTGTMKCTYTVSDGDPCADGHTEETIPGTAATCTETGLTDGVKCSVCGEVLTEQEVIPALGHDFEDGVCTVCGADDPDYVAPGPGETEPALDGVTRIAGADRIATSLGIADQLKETLGVARFNTMIVASALNFPDALTGSYLAAVKSAPILLTYEAAHPQIQAYIEANLASGGTVYILGGPTAVSAGFEDSLKAKGINVVRLAGSDRFGTNLEIMREAGVNSTQPILIATAVNFADSLSASAAGLPMVLVYGSLRDDQKEFLETTSKEFIIIGGTSAVPESIENELKAIGNVTRLAGSSRYQTSVMVAERFVPTPSAVVLAYARNFPDGLCAGPLAVALNAPLILTDNYDPSAADAYVNSIRTGIVVGGAGLISDVATKAIFDLDVNAPIHQK